MASLLDSVASGTALRQAWDDLLARDREDGQLADSVRRFARDSDDRLAGLSSALLDGTYTPRDLTEVHLTEDDGDLRVLDVPTVADRVVERAVLDVVTPYVDPWLGPSSYAYRPGLGVADAVQALARLRDEGLRWVLRADVAECFPSVPVDLARRMLGALVVDDELLAVVDALLGRHSHGRRGRRIVPGLAQGCALSPMLANLVLTGLDDALLDKGFPVVRYADDFAVAVRTRAEAMEAARVASDALGECGMELGADKTEIMSFDDGFCFLGEDFGPRYPPVLTGHRVPEPTQRVVYVGLQGSRLRVESGRLIVESSADEEVLDVPTGHVKRVVCFGSVGVSSGVRSWALSNDVDVAFASRRGTYLGQLLSAAPTRVTRLRALLAAADDEARSAVFGRAVIEAKVRKQIVLLQRMNRRDTEDAVRDGLHSMRQLLLLLPDAVCTAEIMGLEGAAARTYFDCLSALVPAELPFTGRSRQPPLDVPNAALSYGYTILLGECVSALVAAGLDPAIGLLHTPGEGRPSLALDLMEEFRPLVVDQVMLAAARRRELTVEHGRREPGKSGVLLTRAGREALTGGYERRMLQVTRGALPGFSGSLRRHVYRQAQRLAVFVLDPAVQWTGLSWR